MGQGHSRRPSNSPERRTSQRRSVANPRSSTHGESPTEQSVPSRSRSRRYSPNPASLLRHRSSPHASEHESRSSATAPASSQPVRRRSGLSRASASFTNTIPSIFVRNASPSSRSHDRRRILPSPPPYRDLNRSSTNPAAGSASHQPQMPDIDPLYNLPSPNLTQPASYSDRRRREDDQPSRTLADRVSSLTPARALPNRIMPLGRRRRSPLGRTEDQGAMLSRLLTVVAAATAATLMGGNPEAAMSDLRNATGGIEGDDGTFNGFLQALRNGRLTSALGQNERPAEDGGEGGDNPGSLEFFRMFRFGSSSGTSRRHADSSRPSSSRSGTSRMSSHQGDGTEEGGEHRMVPILIVGIRALNGDNDGTHENGDGVPSFLDALTSVPANFNMNLGTPDSPTGPGDGVRISRRRRASFGGLNLFSNGRDAYRPSRPSNAPRSRSDIPGMSGLSSPESPPGPHPPPSTPASPAQSAFSSGTSTPTNRSTYSSSAVPSGPSSRRDSLLRRMTGTTLEPTVEESSSSSSLFPDESSQHSRPTRYRRLSDSDTPRFGSGSSRRNGVLVEPHDSPPFTASSADDSDRNDNDTSPSNSDATTGGSPANRSWIIYILGGSYPENHPILSTPSLFTDSPTYEDMLLLSSLLGPAKPPVATADEVAKAPGKLVISVRPDGLMVTVRVSGDDDDLEVNDESDGVESILADGESCLVCLCDYADGEEARRLIKCGHLFHRECIDQWLTTGRNSCPLCRGQGVDEKASSSSQAQSSQEEAAI